MNIQITIPDNLVSFIKEYVNEEGQIIEITYDNSSSFQKQLQECLNLGLVKEIVCYQDGSSECYLTEIGKLTLN